jgi:DMSO/TMAO reductase YedYZ molybdopterin-dependent catalytic subunit
MTVPQEPKPASANASPFEANRDGRPAALDRPPGGVAVVLQPALFAASLALFVLLLARFLAGVLTPAEVFSDRLTTLIPLPIFARLLDTFGPNAKHLFFGVLLLGEGVLTAAAGCAYWYLRQRLLRVRPLQEGMGSRVGIAAEALVLFACLWLLSAGILAPLIGAGLLGSGLQGGAPGVFGSELLPNAAFAIAFVLLARRAVAEHAASGASAPVTRRRFLQQAGIAVAVIAVGAVAWDFITGGLAQLAGVGGSNEPNVNLGPVPARVAPPTPDYATWSPVAGQAPEVTTATNFYYVSKNLASDPELSQQGWRLSIDGMVDMPYTLTYDELRALPKIERYHTLECISNVVGGNLMSNALFTGASLADMLNMAGIQPGADEVVFRAADDYSDRLHLAQALDSRSLVVYAINGAPLPQAHGYPARLLIPGLYGMKNGKWLTSLSVDAGDYTGYWEQQGWTREAKIKMTTRIDVPSSDQLLVNKPTVIAGVAFAADRGIGRVEVSTDGGETYHPATFHPATLRQPLGPLSWVLWQYEWTPPAGGRYVLMARSIDLAGDVQTPAEAPPLPDGSSGYHRISVLVQ